MREKLDEICRRFDELSARMGDPEVYNTPGLYPKIAKESASLEPIAVTWRRMESIEGELVDARELLEDEDDAEMREMVEAEITELEAERGTLDEKLKILLLPKDPNDHKNAVLEIRAGTGGDETPHGSGETSFLRRFAALRARRRGLRRLGAGRRLS